MKKGYKMTKEEKESRFRQTLENQAEKLFNQQVSSPNQTSQSVESLTNNLK